MWGRKSWKRLGIHIPIASSPSGIEEWEHEIAFSISTLRCWDLLFCYWSGLVSFNAFTTRTLDTWLRLYWCIPHPCASNSFWVGERMWVLGGTGTGEPLRCRGHQCQQHLMRTAGVRKIQEYLKLPERYVTWWETVITPTHKATGGHFHFFAVHFHPQVWPEKYIQKNYSTVFMFILSM